VDDEQQAEIVAESYAGGPVSAVARRHGLTPQQLFSWRRQACQSGLREAEKSGPSFAPIVVEACCPGKDAATSPALAGAALIEILIGRATVRVTPGVDAASLQAVLRAVMAVT
jgi:transposase